MTPSGVQQVARRGEQLRAVAPPPFPLCGIWVADPSLCVSRGGRSVKGGKDARIRASRSFSRSPLGSSRRVDGGTVSSGISG